MTLDKESNYKNQPKKSLRICICRLFFGLIQEIRGLTAGHWNSEPPAFINSGTLWSYPPKPSRFIPISGLFCPYFPVNGPQWGGGSFLASKNLIDWEFVADTAPLDINDRDNVLIPEKINGKYVLLRRPEEYVGEA